MKFVKNNKKILLVLLFLAVIFIAGSFAWIRLGYNGTAINKIKVGTLDLTLDESTSEGIKLEKAVPMSYRQGLLTTEYTFKLTNTGNYTTGYTISFENINETVDENGNPLTITDDNRIADRFIRYILVKNGEEKLPENSHLLSETENRTIDTGLLAATEENSYTLQVWIDSKAGDNNEQDLVMNRFFNVRLKVDAVQAGGSGGAKRYAVVLNGNGGSSTTVIKEDNTAVGNLPNATRTGYTFAGWYTAEEGGEEVTAETPITAEKVTFFAHWTINQYTASFDGNEGTNGEDITKDYNSELGTLPESERVGYTFAGWYTAREGGDLVTANTTMPAENPTYYAHWTVNQYTASFDGNEGTDGEAITKDYGAKLGVLPVSERRGYVFAGWYTEAEGGEEVTANTTMPAENVTYYAHWIVNYHDVIYNYTENEGDSASKATDVVIRDEDIDVTTPTATKAGYDFVGWNTDKTATVGLTSLKMGTEDVTLYAIFRKQVTATFNGNGATLSANNVSCYVYNKNTSCESETVAPTITRAGYTVIGYSANADATASDSTAPTPGQKFTINLGGATYYALTAKTLSSTIYYYNSAQGNQTTTTYSCTVHNEETTCTHTEDNIVTNSVGPNGTEYVGLSSTKEDETTTTNITSDNAKYYAVYEKMIDVNFYYYDNGVATAQSSGLRRALSNETGYTTTNAQVSIPSDVLSSTGPNNGAAYTGVSVSTNSQVGVATPTSENTKYYAYYNGTWAVDYTRDTQTVESIGKSRDTCDNYASTDENTYTTTGVNCGIVLPSITAKAGYTKDGWYENSTKVGSETENYTITKDTTLTARSTINSYVVTYNATENGGTTTAEATSVNYNASIDLTPTATKAGYDFLGWNTDKTATDGLSSLTMGTADVTLYAIFKKSTTISLPSKSSVYTGQQVEANEAVVSDGNPNPTITYAYFTDSGCTSKVPTSTGASIAGAAPIDVGNYYAQATVAAVNGGTPATTFKEAKSNCVGHDIIAKEVAVTWEGSTFVYNGSEQGPTASVPSPIAGETLSVTRTTAKDFGSHTSTATLSVTGGRGKTTNYSLLSNTQSFNITAKQVTATPENKTMTYGSNAPTYTYSLTGVVGSDTAVSGTPTYVVKNSSGQQVTVNSSLPVGTYTIELSGLTATSNYSLSYATGTLTVNKAKAVAPTLSDATATYDEQRHPIGKTGGTSGLTVQYAYRSCPGGTCGSGTWSSWSTDEGNYSGTNAGKWQIKAMALGNSNYEDSDESNVAVLTINPRPTTCTSSSTTVTYAGSAVTAAGGTCTNLLTGHTATFTNSGSQNGVGSSSNTITSVVIKNASSGDISSNYSITKVPGTITVNGITRTATFNPNNNTLSQPSGCSKNSSTGVVTCSCTTTGTNTSCNITSPTITANTNTTSICGYTNSSTGVKTGCSAHNSSTSLTGNPSYYAQTYSDKTGTFTVQDANAATKSGGTETCTAYNGTASCTLTAPKLTNKTGYSVVGWKKDGTTSSITSDLAASGSATVSVTGNVTYKSVTYRTLSVTFSRNTTEISGIGSTTGSCNTYNGGSSCTASSNSPTITAVDGYVALGFFTSNSGTMTSSSSPKLAASTSYTIQTGATDLANKKVQAGTTLYARGRAAIASEVTYSNANTGLKNTSGGNCTETQCALDALGRLLA